MVDITIGSFRLKQEGYCYTIAEEAGLTKDNDIAYKNQTYHTRLEYALTELILYRPLSRADVHSLKELREKIARIKETIKEVANVHGN
jgi:hypothetical protein